MLDDTGRSVQVAAPTELEVVRQQRNVLMARLLDMEVLLALRDDELRRLRAGDPQVSGGT